MSGDRTPVVGLLVELLDDQAATIATLTADLAAVVENEQRCISAENGWRALADRLADALRAMTRLAAPPDMNEWVTWQLSVADPALNDYKEARHG